MNLLEFQDLYPDEASCKRKWREIREKEGIVCPICGCTEYYWKNDKECFECKRCHHRQSLKAGTIMQGSQLPFRYWFVTMHLLTTTKKTFSASELQRQLGHKYYRPIWAMLHKLRQAMGKRDTLYKLDGECELDDGFFTVSVEEDRKQEPLKRGRGSQRKCKVLVMAESEKVSEEERTSKGKRQKTRKVGHIKMVVIDDLKSKTIDETVSKCVATESKLDTDDSTSYVHLKDKVVEHRPKVIPPKETGKLLPWVHIAISNAKRLILDIYHSVDPSFLQSYLDEFCYKFNRRYLGKELFNRLLVACVTCKNEFRYRIN